MRIRTRLAGLIMAAAAVATTGAAVAAPAGAATIKPAATIGCQAYNGGYCGSEQLKFGHYDMDVYQQHAVSGEKVIWWPKSSSDPAQDWVAKNYNGQSGTGGPDKTFNYAPNGVPSTLCLSFPSEARGSRAVLRPCNQSIWQTFEPIAESGGYVEWMNKGSGYVIDDLGFQNQGSQLGQWTSNGGDDQSLRFVS